MGCICSYYSYAYMVDIKSFLVLPYNEALKCKNLGTVACLQSVLHACIRPAGTIQFSCALFSNSYCTVLPWLIWICFFKRQHTMPCRTSQAIYSFAKYRWLSKSKLRVVATLLCLQVSIEFIGAIAELCT